MVVSTVSDSLAVNVLNSTLVFSSGCTSASTGTVGVGNWKVILPVVSELTMRMPALLKAETKAHDAGRRGVSTPSCQAAMSFDVVSPAAR